MSSEWFGILPDFFRHPYVYLTLTAIIAGLFLWGWNRLFPNNNGSGRGIDQKDADVDGGQSVAQSEGGGDSVAQNTGTGDNYHIDGDFRKTVHGGGQDSPTGTETDDEELSGDGGEPKPELENWTPYNPDTNEPHAAAHRDDQIKVSDEFGKVSISVDWPTERDCEWVKVSAGEGIEFDYTQGADDMHIENGDEFKFKMCEGASWENILLVIYPDTSFSERDFILQCEDTGYRFDGDIKLVSN